MLSNPFDLFFSLEVGSVEGCSSLLEDIHVALWAWGWVEVLEVVVLGRLYLGIPHGGWNSPEEFRRRLHSSRFRLVGRLLASASRAFSMASAMFVLSSWFLCLPASEMAASCSCMFFWRLAFTSPCPSSLTCLKSKWMKCGFIYHISLWDP